MGRATCAAEATASSSAWSESGYQMSNMTNEAAATKQEKKNRKERYVHGTQTQFDTRLMYKQGSEQFELYIVGRL